MTLNKKETARLLKCLEVYDRLARELSGHLWHKWDYPFARKRHGQVARAIHFGERVYAALRRGAK